MSRPHDFQASLKKSHAQADAPWWRLVYEAAFPSLLTMACVRQDGWAQRGGIDRVLTLSCGRTITIDEKVRDVDWPDFCLEYLSDEARKTPGWVAKPLACEFIGYAFIPSRTCYLLPTLHLQKAWRDCGADWIHDYKEIRAQNNGYVTVSVAVPIKKVLGAMARATRILWTDEAAFVSEDNGTTVARAERAHTVQEDLPLFGAP